MSDELEIIKRLLKSVFLRLGKIIQTWILYNSNQLYNEVNTTAVCGSVTFPWFSKTEEVISQSWEHNMTISEIDQKQFTLSSQMPSLLYHWPENWPNSQSLPRWKVAGSVKQFQPCTVVWSGSLFTSSPVIRTNRVRDWEEYKTSPSEVFLISV